VVERLCESLWTEIVVVVVIHTSLVTRTELILKQDLNAKVWISIEGSVGVGHGRE